MNQKNLGGFAITYKGETTYLIHNNSTEEISIEAKMFNELIDYIGLNDAELKDGRLRVGPYTSVLLK
ncbi:MAG: hypothetical protein IJI66_05105 [Erysipelotrichaceae bacterium]|nr:hypothetical protein [Erysipelotrichaceae bacterium]